ncbi:FHA domain-containing protein [Microcella humidisoli]|uniref:FHA domain-containing protein n=1 Tax=Microcella humidisoli TaxID=2963406 RepID=A0ABY5FWH9_9MICO|nr:FHA domain-containing protein [Microcella humidisoli]UTT62639.1 FHA domain-containing protein [Microcella humidisoli]
MGDWPEDTGDTVLRPRGADRAGDRPVAPDTGPPSARDVEDTIIRLVEPARPAAAGALPLDAALPPEPPEPDPVDWALRVRGTSTVVPLDVPVVIGRRPGAPRPNEHPVPRRVVIPADRADVSARHARIERLGRSLVVADLGSTNGVVVHWSTGSSLRLRPGDSCAVLPDAIIELGDGVEVEFVAPSIPHPPRPSEPS